LPAADTAACPPHLRQIVRKMAVQIATEKSRGNTTVTVPVHPELADSLRAARAGRFRRIEGEAKTAHLHSRDTRKPPTIRNAVSPRGALSAQLHHERESKTAAGAVAPLVVVGWLVVLAIIFLSIG